MKVFTAAALSLCALGSIASVAAGQLPGGVSQQQLQQMLTQNPDLVRQRLLQSGLTPDQIRARLRAAGYPENLLDAFLGGANSPAPSQMSPAEAAAVQALGLAPFESDANRMRVDTGLIRARGDTTGPISRVYGVDVFQRTSTQFLPLLSGPVPPEYRLGPGDQLVLILTGDVELSYTLPVTREGFTLIPQVGQVFVSNLTLDQLRNMLYTRLSRVYSGVRRGANATTHFDVSVASVRANQIFVVGEVMQPGAYAISSLGTVLTALYVAGGLTERANLRRVEVQRLGKTVATLDLYDYLMRGDTRSDVRLETGDVIYVPLYQTRVDLSGAVVRPAVYELKPGETLSDVIGVAGGFRPNASLRRIAIYRILPPAQRGPGPFARAVVDVQLAPGDRKPTGGAGTATVPQTLAGLNVPNVALIDGDSVVVDSIPPLDASLFVSIAGMVNKPGRYPWREGMTLRELVLLGRGPTVGASLKEAEVARLPADRSRGELAVTLRVPLDSTYLFERDSAGRYVGPPGLAFSAGGAPEVALQPYDNVLILKQPDFDFQRTVVLTGEVRYPGTYSLRTKDERLADVIERAGGLTQQAYPQGIRFERAANAAGRINIDLPRALRERNSRDNIILQPGDAINVPEFQASVKVVGAVNSPGSVLWRQGASLDYYLSAAGGFAFNADKGRVSVRFANGEARTRRRGLLSSSNPQPGPGSEVFVPVKEPSGGGNPVALLGGIAQILSSVVAIVVVLKAK